MAKSALAVARQALAAAEAALPRHPSKFAKRTYTQRQLFAVLAVRQFLKTDYRGVERHRLAQAGLRAAAGLGEPVPDHTIFRRASDRLLEKGGRRPARRVRPPTGPPATSPDCIPARRLFGKGVRVVQLFNGAYASAGELNWDGHSKLKEQYDKHAAVLDQPAAALITDLKRRGLLKDTLVVWCTEFGRMPMFQKGAKGATTTRTASPAG